MPIPDFVLDKRVIERIVAKGQLTKEALAKHLASLPDSEENSEPCTPEPREEEPQAEAEDAEATDES